jgi:hypothetical protein
MAPPRACCGRAGQRRGLAQAAAVFIAVQGWQALCASTAQLTGTAEDPLGLGLRP